MVDKTLSYLDYIKLLDILKSYSSTHFADELISNLLPSSNPHEVKQKQDKLESVLEVIKWDGKIPLSDIPDVDNLRKRLSVRDAILSSEDFILISTFLRACADISAFLKRAHVKEPYLEIVVDTLKPLHNVKSRIMKTINVEGFIEDTASYELSKIDPISLA